MQFTITTVLALSAAVSAAPLIFHRSGDTCSAENTYSNCKSKGVVNLLNCVNILNGNTVDIPISALNVEKRGNYGHPEEHYPEHDDEYPEHENEYPEEENEYPEHEDEYPEEGDYSNMKFCCESKGVINALNCVNLLNGNTLTLALDLLNVD